MKTPSFSLPLSLALALVACGGSTTSPQAPVAPASPSPSTSPSTATGASVDAAPAPAPSTHGHLDPAEIQRVVRTASRKMRYCYMTGLAKNPQLEGRVTVRFEIDPTGAVSQAKDEGSTMADAHVVDCVVGLVGKLSFPAPEGGSVSVVYPFEFKAAGEGDTDGGVK